VSRKTCGGPAGAGTTWHIHQIAPKSQLAENTGELDLSARGGSLARILLDYPEVGGIEDPRGQEASLLREYLFALAIIACVAVAALTR
jgi:hypothetical protein